MAGKAVTSEKVRGHMQTREAGKRQVTASSMAGISERSGRRIEKGELQPGGKQQRLWRTRVAPPFAEALKQFWSPTTNPSA
jgi:hypothetical protein